MVTKPQGVVLARARMPLYLLGLARSQGARGRVGRCWVLSGFILVLSGFYRGSGFIGFYRALVGIGGLWWALVFFFLVGLLVVFFSALVPVDVGL